MEVSLLGGQGPKLPVSGKKNRQEIEEIQKFIITKHTNETASDSGLIAGSRVIRGDQAGSLGRTDTETEVLVACGAPELGLSPLVGQVSVGGGRVFLQVFVVLGATNHAEGVAGGGRGTFRVVLSHALQRKEVGLLGPGFVAVDCCAVVADELQAEFIYEHVEGAKAVARE